MSVFSKIFGTHSQHEVKRILPLVDKIEAMGPEYEKLTDAELQAKTAEFKERLANGETLDDLLPEAYATVREAATRVLGMRHYRVQLIGGVILHQGRITEMRTGEGKTLVSTLPAYLNALEEKGVHIVTVNDYLAKRDAEWMGKVHEFLGLSVGVILNSMDNDERREAYGCDITYATNNELGFDYLRDNMVVYKEELVQRSLHYAIIDEVDSVLIDEARTPLIISGQSGKSTKLYDACDIFARQLTRGTAKELSKMDILMNEEEQETGDYVVDEKDKNVNLTEEGVRKAERFFRVDNLADPSNLELQHNINLALRAHSLMAKDKDYVVKDDEVLIVDEFTGRIMPGRRFSDGLHQAIEAKEHVKVKRESKTLATITFQNFFNKYGKKSGMTGTALTEEKEFREIYGMDVVEVPTNLPVARIDYNDVVYKTKEEKFNAVVEDIAEAHEKGQPVLVGTIAIDTSEYLSSKLQKKGIPHKVLNAKFHELEAEIIADAGQMGAVTIATNMAGRGTDIKLGEGVQELGGLFILGTERHESRRIDNQLRGRSGRQGDNGESRFYLSTEDDLLRKFGAEKLSKIMSTLGLQHGEEIESSLISKTIESAQKKVEAFHFEMRKHLLEYDNVANAQRKVVYSLRSQILQGSDIDDIIKEYANDVISALLEDFITPQNPNYEEAEKIFERIFGIKTDLSQADAKHLDIAKKELAGQFEAKFQERKQEFKDHFEDFSKYILINTLDNRWKQHLLHMDHLRDSVGLRGYGQKDPLIEYKREAYTLFIEMMDKINRETVELIMKVQIQMQTPEEAAAENARRLKQLQAENKKQLKEKRSLEKETNKKTATVKRNAPKIGRNDPCPCGSGKKYKNCHGVQG